MAESLALLSWEERGIVPTQQKLANFIQQLQQTMAVRQDGSYMSYIDPSVIAECVMFSDTTDDIPENKLNQAVVQIDIEDGMPCANGVPIWERLDCEPVDYYKTFKEYRNMRFDAENGNKPFNTRSLARLSEAIGVPRRFLSILAKIYHWTMRVRAYDIQQDKELMLNRARQADRLESKHFDYANKILEQAMSVIETQRAKIDPKLAIQMVEIGMKYGRISTGLLGDKPGTQAAAVHQTNIAISQSTTNNEADNMVNVIGGGDTQGQGGGSQVERQLNDKMKDNTQIASILHVLNKSGAFKAAAKGAYGEGADSEDDTGTDEGNFVAADYDIKEAVDKVGRGDV